MGSWDIPRALARDYRSAGLAPQDLEMIRYAVKLTRTPHEVSAADVDRLLEVGFDATGVLDICQVASYYAYVNRLADGLGVELEDHWDGRELTLDRTEFEAQVISERSNEESPSHE
jgi:uncharacterized peroxidase-related enzyme